ncbi:hypothetical protein JT739_07935 [Tepidanaerobacter sp. GT38]|uniref:hypothetical protein n=1 Tax=Tepidanaerobacter sp. GT38 TaxID=2722793 RepID=UPI001F2D0E26|nr:hypothetical protein [Tepidanaerobacter sp. GT38]MCG1012530.1 hypothetical protein [Tepidanaerobacter sp. GT38]
MARHKAGIFHFTAIKFPRGFDLYVSEDGVNFSSVFLDGLNNPHNYGGRILFVDSENNLYIGTANPFEGCEVWKTDSIPNKSLQPCNNNHYKEFEKTREILSENFKVINDNIPVILELMSKNTHLKSL